MTDRENVAQFRTVMKKAFAHQKQAGFVVGEEAAKIEKLFELDVNDKCVARDGRVLFFWRTFRRRVAVHYARDHRVPVRWQLDWESVWQWILDNWQTIIRMIIFLVPLVV